MASINRIRHIWAIMVSLMKLPTISCVDIMNSTGLFEASERLGTWTIARNIVLEACKHLSDAVFFLGDMIRYKLKEDADMIFDYTWEREFGNTDLSGNPIIKLYRRTLHDYKEEIDCIVDDFIAVASVVPEDQAEIIDQTYCDRTIRVGKLIDKLFQDADGKKGQNTNAKPPSNLLVGVDKLYFRTIILDSCKPPIPEAHGGLYGYATEDEIKSLSLTFWTNIKQVTTRDIHQKFLNLVMVPVKQNDIESRLSNAIQCGVVERQVDKLIKQLVDKTNVDALELEKLVKNSNAMIRKPINKLKRDELQQLYGVTREELEETQQKKEKELKKFIAMKKETLSAINTVNGKSANKWNKSILENESEDDIKDDNESLDEYFIQESNEYISQ